MKKKHAYPEELCEYVETDATMENGKPVRYAANRGSYPEGTSQGLGKDYGKKPTNGK